MKITVFRSDKGDCLLLQDQHGTSILADGGIATSYRAHVAPHLANLVGRNKALDLTYVSHIDADHIAGILAMMDDLVAWKVYDYQRNNGNARAKKPRYPRPPNIEKIWHNAFSELVSKNLGSIKDQLATDSRLLMLRTEEWAKELSGNHEYLAYSERQAELLNRRIGSRQLGIPQNPETSGKLISIEEVNNPLQLGGFEIVVIGPSNETLRDLRKQWNKWLRSEKGKRQLRKIGQDAKRDEERLQNNEFKQLTNPLLAQANALGNRKEVTTPNLASLMLLIKEDNKSILMTGDGHPEDILSGLEAIGQLNNDGMLHVNVLKVQHHGATANMTKDFAKRITADNYIFCGNGAHGNPEPEVLNALLDARLGPSQLRSTHPLAKHPFKFWFNENEDNPDAKYPSEMAETKRLIERRRHRVGRKILKPEFLSRDYFTLNL